MLHALIVALEEEKAICVIIPSLATPLVVFPLLLLSLCCIYLEAVIDGVAGQRLEMCVQVFQTTRCILRRHHNLRVTAKRAVHLRKRL